MPIVVNHPLARVEFPDDTTTEEINATLVELEAKHGPEIGVLEAGSAGLRQGFTSTKRGIIDLLPDPLAEARQSIREFVYGEGVDDTAQRDEFAKEFQYRVAQEQQPVAATGGRIAGDVLDPIGALIPFTRLQKAAKGLGQVGSTIAAGMGAGAIGGLAEPTYEELGDSAVFNILAGTAGGGAIGGIAGLLAKRFGKQIEEPEIAPPKEEAPVTPEVTPVEALQPEMPKAPEMIPVTPEYKMEEMLPSFRKATPRVGDKRVTFDNDLDRALYMVGKGGKNTEPMINYAKRVTGLDDETIKLMGTAEYNRVVKKVKADTKAKPYLKTIPMRSSSAYKDIIGTKIAQTEKKRATELAQVAKLKEQAQAPAEVLPVQAGTPTKTNRDIIKEVRAQAQAAETGGSVGSSRVSPLRQRPDKDVPEADVRKVMEGQPEAIPPGRAKPFLEAEEMNDFAQRMSQIFRKGSRKATGRAARQGLGTQSALANAGAKRATQLVREAGTLNDYFIGLRGVDPRLIDPEDIIASAPVQSEADQIVKEVVQDYANAITKYGDAESIPADIQRDLVERAFNSIMVKQTISGSLTRASDMFNAQKMVNKARRKDEALAEMLGERCY